MTVTHDLGPGRAVRWGFRAPISGSFLWGFRLPRKDSFDLFFWQKRPGYWHAETLAFIMPFIAFRTIFPPSAVSCISQSRGSFFCCLQGKRDIFRREGTWGRGRVSALLSPSGVRAGPGASAPEPLGALLGRLVSPWLSSLLL